MSARGAQGEPYRHFALRRPDAWASSRLATLAQAIASTSSTTTVSAARNAMTAPRSRGGSDPAGSNRKPPSFSD